MPTLSFDRGRVSRPVSRDRNSTAPGFIQQMRSYSRNRSSSRTRRSASPGSFFSRFSSGSNVGRSSITLNDGARISLTNLNNLPQNRKVARIRRWDGHIRDVTEWDALRKDPELWMPDGDCLVYLYADGASRRGPSFRVSFAALTSTQCEPLLYNYLKTNIPSTPTSSNSSDYGTFGSGYRKYELFIPAPDSYEKTSAHDFHLATRNFFAWVFGKPVVGAHLGHALVQLVQRMDMFRSKEVDNVQDVIEYMTEEGLSDFRDSPDHALGGLYFSECYRLRELWTDAFVHCVGMNDRLVESTGLDSISRKSKALITRARLEMDVRFEWASTALTTFLENELVGASKGLSPLHLAHLERFRSVLHTFYVNSFGYWPPYSMDSRGGSFSRAIYRSMYFEFRNLYEYLVDTESTLDESKPMREAISFNILQSVDAFDAKQKFTTLPNSLPLLPESSTTNLQPQLKQKNAIGRLRQFESKTAKADRRQAALRALRQATNSEKSQVMECALVHVYQDFETQCTTKDEDKISPADGRAVRWLLVYGIFQTLISLIRAPREVRQTEGVDYMLCVQTAGTPPWKDLPAVALPPKTRGTADGEERGRSRDRVDRTSRAATMAPKIIPMDKTRGQKQQRARHTAIFIDGYGDGAGRDSNDVSPVSSRRTTMTSGTSISRVSAPSPNGRESTTAPKVPLRSPLHNHVAAAEESPVVDRNSGSSTSAVEKNESPSPENPLGSHPVSRNSLSLRRLSYQSNPGAPPPVPHLKVDTTPRQPKSTRSFNIHTQSEPASVEAAQLPSAAGPKSNLSPPLQKSVTPSRPAPGRPEIASRSVTVTSVGSNLSGSSFYDDDGTVDYRTAASSKYSLNDLTQLVNEMSPSKPADHVMANTSVPRHLEPSPLALASPYHEADLYDPSKPLEGETETGADLAFQEHVRRINAAHLHRKSQLTITVGPQRKDASPALTPGAAFIANPFNSTKSNPYATESPYQPPIGTQVLSNQITPTLIHNTPLASPVIPTHGNLLRTAGRPPSVLVPSPGWTAPNSWQTGAQSPRSATFNPSPPISSARRENPLAVAGRVIASAGGRTSPRPPATGSEGTTTSTEPRAPHTRTISKTQNTKASAATSKPSSQTTLDGPRWSPELQKLMADRDSEERGRKRHREPYMRINDEDHAPAVPPLPSAMKKGSRELLAAGLPTAAPLGKQPVVAVGGA